MSPADWSRIAKFGGLLGSQGDGEVVNAARMIDKALKSQGLTWGDFVARVAGGASYSPMSAARTRAEAAQAQRRGEQDAWEKRMQDEEEKARQWQARRRKGREW